MFPLQRLPYLQKTLCNTVDYINEAKRQLDDENVYELLTKDPTQTFNKDIKVS